MAAGGEVAGEEAGDMIAVMARRERKKIGGSRAYRLAVPGVPGMRCPDNQLLLWILFQGTGHRLSLSEGARVVF